MKKLRILLLAFALCVSMAVTSFAADRYNSSQTPTPSAENIEVAYVNWNDAGFYLKNLSGADQQCFALSLIENPTFSQMNTLSWQIINPKFAYEVGNLAPETKYYVFAATKAIIYPDNHYSNWSTPITITTGAMPAPENVKITSKGGKATISCDPVSGATGYKIAYKKSSAKKYTIVTINTSDKSAKKTIAKLKKGTKYNFKVRAYFKLGDKTYYSNYSAVKTVKAK